MKTILKKSFCLTRSKTPGMFWFEIAIDDSSCRLDFDLGKKDENNHYY